MVRVLFVCLGNICRSPMAEAVFAHFVAEAGLEKEIEVDSAGTGQWHVGERPHHGTRHVLASKNIPYDGRARVIDRSDLDLFDYIVVMDNANLRDVQFMGKANGRVVRLMDFARVSDIKEVPDPYYDGRFELVYE